jgi:isoquinoline 1-oxidoreductase
MESAMTPPRPVLEIEPERYELSEPSRYSFELSRRDFLAGVGAGVVVLVITRGAPVWAELPDGQQQVDSTLGAWLHIAEDGRVTVYTGKVEVGQDIRTSLTQAVAEELHVAPSAITMVMGDTDRVPYDMGTFGSRSTPQMGTQLRRAAAAARNTLLQRAAETWRIDATRLSLADGRVREISGQRTASIGEITRGARLVQAIQSDVTTRPPAQWSVAGKTLPKVAGHAIVTGRHRYPADQKLPGMLVGKVLRAPGFGATLERVDASAARALPGVTVVTDGNFVGVAAPDEASAARALALIEAQWTFSPQPSHREIFQHLKQTASGNRGDAAPIESALAAADHRLAASYSTAYIAHVPLEPRAATAHWQDGKLTAWTGTQRPFGVRAELVRAFNIPEERVRVLVPDTGSGYGGKHTGECAIEAARLAQAANAPVKVVWTREEEFAWAYFRPAALIEIRSGVSKDGTLTAWEFFDYNAGASGLRTPYDVASRREVHLPAQTPLRQGSYRALAATANNFAREAHMDELAAAVNLDRLAFRLKNLRDDRLRAVLNAAAQSFGWSRWSASAGRGIGIACGTEKGGYSATCAEVAVDRTSGRVSVVRIVQAFECGAIVNPDGLENQVEGSVVMGLGGALWEAIEFENGRILNPRLSQYRVPRFSDMPPIDIVLLDRKDLPSAGAGETPIITLAPALAGAIFQATGTRLRALPLAPHGL